jgi:hypothetical protein
MSSLKKLDSGTVLEWSEALTTLPTYASPLAKDNALQVRAALNESGNTDFSWGNYAKGDIIVTNGSLELGQEEFEYSAVPLGLIVRGSVIVLKDGKATKKLTEGDFIGLFETSDWLQIGRRRHIGSWTLIADTDADVLFFSKKFLKDDARVSFRDYLVSIARTDPVPQPLSAMPLLDWVAEHTTHHDFSDFGVIAHTHLLPSNLPLFRHLAHLVGPQHMFVMEKPYSTVPSVKADLVHAGCEVVPVKTDAGTPYAFSAQKSAQILWEAVLEEYKKGTFSKLLIPLSNQDLGIT